MCDYKLYLAVENTILGINLCVRSRRQRDVNYRIFNWRLQKHEKETTATFNLGMLGICS